TKIFSPEDWNPAPDEQLNICDHSMVTNGYFETMGIALIRGRCFDDRDRVDSQPSVIISDSIAKRFWPDQDPIGKRLKWGPPQATTPWLTVVGVVADVKNGPLDQKTRAHTYQSYAQAAGGLAMFGPSNVAVRSSITPEALTNSVREAVGGLDPQLAINNIRTMTEVMETSISPRRFNTFLLSVFAGAALLLSAVGIYGVIAYSVVQRRREIGVRMALGASRGDVVGLIVRQGMLLAAVGIGLGLAGAVVLTRFLSALLYEVSPIDPLTMAAGGAALGLVALLATFVPAQRATKLDPVEALRSE